MGVALPELPTKDNASMTRFASLGLHHYQLIMATVLGLWLMADVPPAPAQSGASPLPSFDFRQAGAVAGWGESHDVSRIEATTQGMAVHIDGPDPYIFGLAREYPAGTPLLLKIRLKSSEGGVVPGLLLQVRARKQ
jgi:hypothetical protein